MAVDLTGQRSGKLTALYRLDKTKRGREVWLARCDCGRLVQVIAYDFSHGRIQSCGCSRKGKNMKDLHHMQFGRLTAVERLPEKKDASYMWLCRCSCGNEVKASTAELLGGRKKSCGCLKADHCQKRTKDIAGQKFGSLTALQPTGKRLGGSVVWQCRCDCGNICEASYNELQTGDKKSCGCLKSMHPAPPAFRWEAMTREAFQQRKVRSNNTSGHTGVQKTRNGNWHAYITVKGHTYHLGTYTDMQQAVFARYQAEELVLNQSEAQAVRELELLLDRNR